MPENTSLHCAHIYADDDDNNNNNNNNNRIERHNLRLFTISSLCCELSPTRTLKWPRGNCVHIMYNTSGTHHVQHVMCHMVMQWIPQHHINSIPSSWRVQTRTIYINITTCLCLLLSALACTDLKKVQLVSTNVLLFFLLIMWTWSLKTTPSNSKTVQWAILRCVFNHVNQILTVKKSTIGYLQMCFSKSCEPKSLKTKPSGIQ